MSRRSTQDGRVLHSLGLSESEERVYEELLESKGASVPQLARITGMSTREVGQVVNALEAIGLASRSAGPKPTYLPAPAELALDRLLLRRERELESAREQAARFVERFRETVPRTPGEIVEVVSGSEAISLRVSQLQRTAEEEFLGLDRPPYVMDTALESVSEPDHIRRGVRHRIIYDSSVLAVPGRLESILALVDAGEEARVLDSVPLKLAIADDKLALLPLDLKEMGTEGLLIHPCSLLDSLRLLFDMLWKQATPIAAVHPKGRGDSVELGPEDRRLLVLLAAGHKEDAIATQLGVHPRTVERRLGRLMEILGARTRFQLGLQVMEQGLLAQGKSPKARGR